MQLTFNSNDNEKQRRAYRLWADGTTTEIVYGGAKGSGKSFLGCSLIFGDALMYPDTFYFIARRTLADLVKYTIPSIYEVLAKWGIGQSFYTYNGQNHFFQLHNGSRVYLVEAKWMPSDPLYERFGSMQMTRGWIEEGGEVASAAKNNLGATVGRWNNERYGLKPKLLITCNPTNNWLYSDFYKPWRGGGLPSWRAFVPALPSDNRRLPSSYIENLERILTRAQKERLLYGNWEWEDDPLSLMATDAIADAFTNDFIKADGGKKYISTDLAGKGRDRWVVALWRGDVVSFPIVRGFADGKTIEGELRSLAEAEGVARSRIVSDADGLGFFLESYLNGINEFHGGERANDSRTFANLRAECAYKLAEMVNKRAIRIECSEEWRDTIAEELGAVKAVDADADERRRALIPKEHIRRVLGRSPDFLDAISMGMWWRVKPESRGGNFARVESSKM